MKQKTKVIATVVAVLVVCASLYAWNEKRKNRELLDETFTPIDTEFKRSEKSKESSRRSVAEFKIEQQKDRVKLAQELHDIDKNQDSRDELNRAKDKLERLQEVEQNRRTQ